LIISDILADFSNFKKIQSDEGLLAFCFSFDCSKQIRDREENLAKIEFVSDL
jgi:hypothetical protein